MSKRFNIYLYYFLQLTWGIIQNILGFLIYIILLIKNPRRKKGTYLGARVLSWSLKASAAIGMFIFLEDRNDDYLMNILVHEYGHTIQSCILGPLYLLVIGIPSFIWARNKRFIRKRQKGIYRYGSFFPERWANQLGRKYTGYEAIKH